VLSAFILLGQEDQSGLVSRLP